MRLHQEYEFDCIQCGGKVVTVTEEGYCPNCGKPFRIEWQAEYRPTRDTRTMETISPPEGSGKLP